MMYVAAPFLRIFSELVPGMLTFYVMAFLLTGLLGRQLVTVNRTISRLYHICLSCNKLSVTGKPVVTLSAYLDRLSVAIQ